MMKIRWKLTVCLIVFIADILCAKAMYNSYKQTKDALFLSVDSQEGAGGKFSSSKQIALTFDDGPHSVYTSKLLDGLRRKGIHATFFLLGENIEGKEAIVKQMQEDGHLIGNHGYSHVQMSKESVATACKQIEETNKRIEKITGIQPQYLRPPYGEWSDELECAIHMTVVLWNKDPLDWKNQNSRSIVRYITRKIEPGDIILLHDVYPTSIEAALEAIDILKKQGYSFVTVDELLID